MDALTRAAEDFEREQICPLRPTHMNLGALTAGSLKQQETVVLYVGEVPEHAVQRSHGSYRLANQVPNQIENVNSVLQKNTAARQFAIGAPVILIPRATAVSVTAAQEVEGA